jgi:hypothetical protein
MESGMQRAIANETFDAAADPLATAFKERLRRTTSATSREAGSYVLLLL